MKRTIKVLTLLSLLILVGCSNFQVDIPPEDDSSQEVPIEPPVENPPEEEEPPIEEPSGENDAIIVYFSATGNTERVANIIGNYIGSPLYELEPVDSYTSEDLNYNNENSRVFEEHEDSNRVVELVNTSFEGFDEAEYILLGFLVWRREPSRVVDELLRNNDFEGKNIIPFGTSSASQYSTENKIGLAPEANWIGNHRFSSRANESLVTEWIDSLNIDFNS